MKFTKKRIWSWLVYLFIFVVTLELSPYILSGFILDQSFSRKKIRKELAEDKTETQQEDPTNNQQAKNQYLGNHILHPYLGFVGVEQEGFNEFHFPGISPITKKSDNDLNVVLMGGSVARELYVNSGERIRQKLGSSDKYKNKNIKLVVLALSGFKQPQQLLALNYFMALGAGYDIVVNLDGFNEVVLPYADNLPFHVFPSYPRHWNIYSRKKLDSRSTLLLGKQAVVKDKRNNYKRSFSNSTLNYSNFALFIWKVIDNNFRNKIFEQEAEFRQMITNNPSDYQSTGIYTNINDTASFFDDQAELWKNCSQQIAFLSEKTSFEYYHFLQPNQYVDGSKEFTKEELDIAIETGPFPYRDAAQMGYPLLVEKGRQLTENGVDFTDLTQIFKNETKTVYSDKCCHFNQLGYNQIADRIAEKILE